MKSQGKESTRNMAERAWEQEKGRKRLTRNSYAIRIVHGTFHEETHDEGERKGQTETERWIERAQDLSFLIDQTIAEPQS